MPLIRFSSARDFDYIEINRVLHVFTNVVEETVRTIGASGGSVHIDPDTDLMIVNDEFTTSIVICSRLDEHHRSPPLEAFAVVVAAQYVPVLLHEQRALNKCLWASRGQYARSLSRGSDLNGRGRRARARSTEPPLNFNQSERQPLDSFEHFCRHRGVAGLGWTILSRSASL